MPRRPAVVTQADVARAIRAAHAAGLTVARIIVSAAGATVETTDAPNSQALPEPPVEPKRVPVL